jgi:hypothetical protein
MSLLTRFSFLHSDSAERLNVALTRAKRVLRIVGDVSFFLSLRRDSTLRRLAEYATRNTVVEIAKIKTIAWSRPNWDQQTRWKPVVTERFRHCLKARSERDRNIFFNTMFAIAQPDPSSLMSHIPRRDKPSWYISNLAGFPEHRIVWIAKQRGEMPSIEAFFGGKYHECLTFIQVHQDPPQGSCVVKKDLSGIQMHAESCVADKDNARRELWAAWPMTNVIQSLVYDNQELPAGNVQLDPCQEEVALSPPPLMIESRSGTGKTLVLLQHAAYHSDWDDTRPALFVTVSPRLRNKLQKDYVQLNRTEHLRLPDTTFFSFKALLDRLIELKGIRNFSDATPCTFLGYTIARTSHQRIALEPHLIENEIGGVIMGSLSAAIQGRLLSRQEYLAEKRSNIGNNTDHDVSKRELVYDEFELYAAWKTEQNKYDISDVIITLLKEDWVQLFSSGTLNCFAVLWSHFAIEAHLHYL